MQVRHLIAVAFLAVSLGALPVRAQEAAPRIAIVSLARVFDGMQERKDAQDALDSYLNSLNQERDVRKHNIEKLQADLTDLDREKPQYAEKNNELLKLAIDMDAWARISQMEAQRRQKQMMLSLFNKIREAVSKVAQEKGYALVINEQVPDMPPNSQEFEKLNPDQVKAIINGRNILFNSGKLDLTADVVAWLDREYTSKSPTTKAPAK